MGKGKKKESRGVKDMGRVIGIDLGAMYAKVAYREKEAFHLIENQEGEVLTPTAVYFDENGTVCVGAGAKYEAAHCPEDLVECFVNYLGDPEYSWYLGGEDRTPAEITALLLQKLVSDAEKYLGEKIFGAVITCPDSFDRVAKESLKQAAEAVRLSGGGRLRVLEIVENRLAAAKFYSQKYWDKQDKRVLFYDLGGKYFDCSLMQFTPSGEEICVKTLARSGGPVGGFDWDRALSWLVCEKFCAITGHDVEDVMADPEVHAFLNEHIESLRRILTRREQVSLALTYGGRREKLLITQEECEEKGMALLDRTLWIASDMLASKGLNAQEHVDLILPLGGCAKMPLVQRLLECEYGKPILLDEPDHFIAYGAAALAEEMKNDALSEEPPPALETSAEEMKNSTPSAEPPALEILPENQAEEASEFRLVGFEKGMIHWDAWSESSVGIQVLHGGRVTVFNLVFVGDSLPKTVNVRDVIEIIPGYTNGMAKEIRITLVKSKNQETYYPPDESCTETATVVFREPGVWESKALNLSLRIDAHCPGTSTPCIDTLTLHNEKGGVIKEEQIQWKKRGYLKLSPDSPFLPMD